jgi:acyl carrier protein
MARPKQLSAAARSHRQNPATVPIGRAIANDEIYILDSNLQPAPIGLAGELCVGGAGLAQGYLNRAEETAARFIAHPFSSTGHLYRTGDLARFLPTGDIEFLGRIDDQVKIRGYRVEPAEIESVLKKHASVLEVATVAYTDGPGDNQLAAYVVPRTRLAADELRRFLQQQLPDYMVPATIIFLDDLPLSANGKVDRRALPSPLETKQEREFVAPRTPDEEKLAAIWTEVLKLARVSVTDSFFDLGGHSLLATQIISRIRNTFRVQLPLHSFLETPTIAGVAEKIVHSPAAETEDDEIARLLQELEGLSEEEAARLLASQNGSDGEDRAKSGKASG